ncbi:MAG TPA: hypothetical protein VH598_06165 [Verrucomicrobiae bacterium]|nr:hypothetical protein [Verrucomicrobiae bacterium]
MLPFNVIERGFNLAIQGLDALDAGTSTESEFKRELLIPANTLNGRSRRSTHPIQLKEVKNIARHSIVIDVRANARAITGRRIQFHGREQIHEQSHLIDQAGASQLVFAGRGTRQKRETEHPRTASGKLILELQPLSLARNH